MEVALSLLESYVHLNEEQIAYAVCSTLRRISTRPEFGSAVDRRESWARFTDTMIVSFPLGGRGDASASGYIFARIAERLGLPHERICDTEHLVPRVAAGEFAPVIFLDDIAASGTQFTRDWNRVYETDEGEFSLAKLKADRLLGEVYYLPVVSTKLAKSRIESDCGISVEATYLLDEDYGATDANTRLVPPALRAELQPFLEKYGPRTGNAAAGVAGFGDLGLALSFHHGSPNNTLPVLQWGEQGNGWRPLVS